MLNKIKFAIARMFMPKWLEGYKTAIGIVGITIYIILKSNGVEIDDKVLETFCGILGIGVIDKVRRVEEQSKTIQDELRNIYIAIENKK